MEKQNKGCGEKREYSKCILRKLLIIFPMLLVFLNISCINYHESKTYDPFSYAHVGFNGLCWGEEGENAKAYCEEISINLSGTILDVDHPLQIEIDDLLREVYTTYGRMVRNSKLYQDYHLMPNIIMYNKPIRIKIFAVKEPKCVAYPNMEIHFSRSILDEDSPFGTKNRNQKIALIAHEMIHLLHGHICYQWQLSDAYNEFITKKNLYELTNLTKVLPISYTKSIVSNRDLTEIRNINQLIEYLADYATVLILNQLGIDQNEYIDILERLYKYYNKNYEKTEIPDSFSTRILCLKNMNHINSFKYPDMLVLENGNQIYGIDISNNKFIKDFIVFWIPAMKQLGYYVYIDNFILYNDNTIGKATEMENYMEYNYQNNIPIIPVKSRTGIVFPYSILNLPIYPL